MGVNAANGKKLLFTLVALAVVWAVGVGLSGTYAVVAMPPLRVRLEGAAGEE